MAIWFLTIGNSDVQFKTADNWYELYDAQRDDYPLSKCGNNFSELDQDEATERFSTAARVIGLVYSNQEEGFTDLQEEYFTDLVFPLLDVFTQELESQSLSKIYLILSDQSGIFDNEAIEKPECPFWMDTCTLEPLIRKYLNNKFPNAEIIPLIIKPENEELRGIDHWDYMLDCVSKKLTQKCFPSDSEEEIYVSHQAGTPAISSAVQFVSIGHSDRLKFLISNQTYNSETQEIKYEAELIESSKYWRNIQIQKAQKLLIEGNPSAADIVLEGVPDVDRSGIKEMVSLFNLKSSKTKNSDEFEPLVAAERVRDALDLIEIFLGNENYLQAITLLAAAHETFLKAAIIYMVNTYCQKKSQEKFVDEWLFWDEEGLSIKTTSNNNLRLKLKQVMKIPNPVYEKFSASSYEYFNVNNTSLFQWLKDLISTYMKPHQWVWNNLQWTMKYKREYDDDLRNQLMHNLRGIEKKHLLAYLKGEPQNRDRQDETEDLETVFRNEIKDKFILVMSKIFLNDDGKSFIANDSNNKIRKDLKDLSDRLSATPKKSEE